MENNNEVTSIYSLNGCKTVMVDSEGNELLRLDFNGDVYIKNKLASTDEPLPTEVLKIINEWKFNKK